MDDIDDEMISPPSTPGIIEFVDINEDCLEFIFRFLSLTDLNSIRATCQNLDAVVNIMPHYHRHFKSLNIAKMAKHYLIDIGNINGYLTRYGAYIEHIDFDNVETNMTSGIVNEIFSYIASNRMDALKSLKIYNVNLTAGTISKPSIQELFKRLTKFEINFQCDWAKMFPMCPNLETLIINNRGGKYPINLSYVFPKLKAFQLINFSNNVLVSLPLEQFARTHNNLTTLSLSLASASRLDINFIRHLKVLEELQLDISQVNRLPFSWSVYVSSSAAHPMSGLTKLKKVHIMHGGRDIFLPFIRNSTAAETLEHLAISYCPVSESLIEGLSRFRKLRYLSLNRDNVHTLPTTDVDMASVASNQIWERLRQLNAVTELHIANIHNRLWIPKFMNNLVLNNLAITKLILKDCCLNATSTIAYLSTLHNLQCLELRTKFIALNIEAIVNAIDWPSLKHLTQMKELDLSVISVRASPTKFLINFLNNLGSTDTLKQLRWHCTTTDATDALFQAIRNFSNLEIIIIDRLTRIKNSHMKLLNMKGIKEFSVKFKTGYGRDLSVNSFIDLVQRNPRLELLQWVNYSDPKSNRFDAVFYNNLVDIVKNRIENRHLRITCFPLSVTIPHYSSNKKFVEFINFISDVEAQPNPFHNLLQFIQLNAIPQNLLQLQQQIQLLPQQNPIPAIPQLPLPLPQNLAPPVQLMQQSIQQLQQSIQQVEQSFQQLQQTIQQWQPPNPNP